MSLPTIHTLASGLTVALFHLPGASAASLTFSVQAGPRFESEEGNGATHVLEHMLFHGCEAHPTPALHTLAFEDVGGTPEGITDLGEMCIELTVPKRTLHEAVDLLGNTVAHPTFDGFETGLMAAQMAVEEDYGAEGEITCLATVLYGRMFGEHPSGRPINGTPASLKRLTREKVRREHARLFVGGNCVLGVAGDLEDEAYRADLLYRIGQAFDLPLGGPIDVVPFVPPVRKAPDLFFTGEADQQTIVNVGFHGPKWAEARGPASRVLLSLLGEGIGSRMGQTLRGARGLCLEHAGDFAGRMTDPLAIFVFLSMSDRAGEAVKAFLGMLNRVASQGVYPDELTRMKRILRLDVEKGLSDPSMQAYWYGVDLLHEPVEALGVASYLARLDGVTLLDVQEAARVLFAPENMTMVVDSATAQGVREIGAAVERYGKPRLAS